MGGGFLPYPGLEPATTRLGDESTWPWQAAEAHKVPGSRDKG